MTSRGYYLKPKDRSVKDAWDRPKYVGFYSLLIENTCIINHTRPNPRIPLGFELSDDVSILQDRRSIKQYTYWKNSGKMKTVNEIHFNGELNKFLNTIKKYTYHKTKYEKLKEELLSISLEHSF